MPFIIDQELCEQDDHCLDACPVEAIEKADSGSLFVKADDCTDCGACEAICDFSAIRPTG